MKTIEDERLIRNPWLQVTALVLCLSVLYYKVILALVDDWVNLPDFSHGFFIPLVSLYFVWERKDKIKEIEMAPSVSGLLILVLGLCMLFLGNLGAEFFIMRLSLLVVIAGIILFLVGKNMMRVLLFPVSYLIFMIPLPSILLGKITFPLQLFASWVATKSLMLFGIPVFREGNVISLTNTTLEVAEACSGLRSLISLVALGTAYAFFALKKGSSRTVLIAACVPIAVFVNAVRVSATGILAHLFGDGVAQGFYHDFSGYVLFVGSFSIFLVLGFMLSKLENTHR